MENLQLFNFNGNDLRIIVDENGDPLFVAKDVSEVLGYSATTKMMTHVDEEDFIHAKMEGMNMKSILINESGLYAAVLNSTKPEAKPFKRWVTKEVLPSIRKHGGYLTPQKTEELIQDPDLIIQLATNLKQERERVKSLESKNAQLQVKADFVDKIIDTDEKIDIGQAAKILELPFGRNTLFQKLREKGVFFKQKNEPKQPYIDRGYFQLKEKWIDRNNHDSFMVIKVLVTQRGLEFISRLFSAEPDSKQLARLT